MLREKLVPREIKDLRDPKDNLEQRVYPDKMDPMEARDNPETMLPK